MDVRAAVLGHPIAHSLSPALHAAAYRALGLDDWDYGRHDVDEDGLRTFLAGLDRGWAGLSLTMPLKHRALELVDHLEPLAAAVGAVNTVLVAPAGPPGASGAVTLTGTNTDVYGLVQALREGLGTPPPGNASGTDGSGTDGSGTEASGTDASGTETPGAEVTSAVVLGGGATAASALAALAQLGCVSPRVLVRSLDRVGQLRAAIARMGITPDVAEADLSGADGQVPRALAAADVVVSTLPPRAADQLAAVVRDRPGHPRGVLLDVAYDPRPTALHTAWTASGGVAVPGERMLLHQAVEQVRLMTGRDGVNRTVNDRANGGHDGANDGAPDGAHRDAPDGVSNDVLAAMDAALAAALDM
ncbi:shikimate dehydrogenase [Myceligenerans indicum]|uniref:Shikimate dehydrogenase n=1 Tax=Myceligenerans indicum TaxID=2593663 RepID=A0ABS1LLL0_9MICO|nr:shikimate dehydrogenase [Myceligenerans indicum]MBL0887121.1 shikimate dehydrogenase [Myceligenerans indicum]